MAIGTDVTKIEGYFTDRCAELVPVMITEAADTWIGHDRRLFSEAANR